MAIANPGNKIISYVKVRVKDKDNFVLAFQSHRFLSESGHCKPQLAVILRQNKICFHATLDINTFKLPDKLLGVLAITNILTLWI